MRNIDTWTAANKYSATLMIFEGIGLIIIGLITSQFDANGPIGTGTNKKTKTAMYQRLHC
jgi:hypothetical protein